MDGWGWLDVVCIIEVTFGLQGWGGYIEALGGWNMIRRMWWLYLGWFKMVYIYTYIHCRENMECRNKIADCILGWLYANFKHKLMNSMPS